MTTTTSAPASIQTRRMAFEASLQEVPRHFGADGDLLSSHIAACLSSVSPDGEDLFVRSVRRFRDQVADQDLEQRVDGFIGQEAIHGREHRVLNRRLAELGYPTRFIERATKRLLAPADEVLPAKACLAATAALEHDTATLAEQLLHDDTKALFGDQRVLGGFHPSDRDATELLEQWREELFGAEGTRNDRLAGVN